MPDASLLDIEDIIGLKRVFRPAQVRCRTIFADHGIRGLASECPTEFGRTSCGDAVSLGHDIALTHTNLRDVDSCL